MISCKRQLENELRERYFKSETHAPANVRAAQQLISKDGESQTVPRIHFVVTSCPVTSGFETLDQRERTATLTVIVVTSPDDSESATADSLVDGVESMLQDETALIAAINAGSKVLLYACNIEDIGEEVDERHHIVTFSLNVPFVFLPEVVEGGSE